MLSGETASGLFPLESVEVMHKICLEAENVMNYHTFFNELRAVQARPLDTMETVRSQYFSILITFLPTWYLTACCMFIFSRFNRTLLVGRFVCCQCSSRGTSWCHDCSHDFRWNCPSSFEIQTTMSHHCCDTKRQGRPSVPCMYFWPAQYSLISAFEDILWFVAELERLILHMNYRM